MISNPKGIDRPIQEMQQLFIDKLWTNIDMSKKQFNHRVFKNYNPKNGLIYPGLHVNGTRDYKNVVFDDKLTVLSWFDVANETNSVDGEQVTQNVGVFFAVNLVELYPNLFHRTEEEAHVDVRKIMKLRASEFQIQGIVTNREAYGDFDTIPEIQKYNMNPWHVFRLNCNLSFTLNC